MIINGVINGIAITKQNIPKNANGISTTNLNAKAKRRAVKIIFCFTPLNKDSTTFLEALAPANLNALYANKILGKIPKPDPGG